MSCQSGTKFGTKLPGKKLSNGSRSERRDPDLAFASVRAVGVHRVVARDEPAAEEFITRHELHLADVHHDAGISIGEMDEQRNHRESSF